MPALESAKFVVHPLAFPEENERYSSVSSDIDVEFDE